MSDLVLTFSAELDKIAPALIVAQGNMTAVRKEKTNPAFRSKYADLETVLDAVVPALQSSGIAFIQAPGGDGETITVETMLLHASGQFIRGALKMKPAKADPQGGGSAITYARRYAALAMCGVAPEDDDGNAAARQPAAQQNGKTPAQAAAPANGHANVADADRKKRAVRQIYSLLGVDGSSKDKAVHADALARVSLAIGLPQAAKIWSDISADALEKYIAESGAQLLELRTVRDEIAKVLRLDRVADDSEMLQKQCAEITAGSDGDVRYDWRALDLDESKKLLDVLNENNAVPF